MGVVRGRAMRSRLVGDRAARQETPGQDGGGGEVQGERPFNPGPESEDTRRGHQEHIDDEKHVESGASRRREGCGWRGVGLSEAGGLRGWKTG